MFKYGMRLRGFSPGCQPMSGLVRREDDQTGRYHDILIYSLPLNDHEQEGFELDYLGEVEVRKKNETFSLHPGNPQQEMGNLE